jgi:predicted RNA-binding protein
MCLAKAYVRATEENADAQLLMENVTRVAIDGDQVRLTSLLGDVEELPGRVTSIDFMEGRLGLERLEG